MEEAEKYECEVCGLATTDIEKVRIGGWTDSGGSQDKLNGALLMLTMPGNDEIVECRDCWANRTRAQENE